MSDQDPSNTTTLNKEPWLKRLLHRREEVVNLEHIRKDLKSVVKQGILELDTAKMIDGVLKVADLTVLDIMISRANVVTLQLSQSMEEMLAIITESGHSRFPVLGTDNEEIIGILISKDLLKLFGQTNIDIHALLRPPQYEPEGKSVNALLQNFKANHEHLAIVLDEYGSISGIVTIEDVLEEIVGEIDDEHDKILANTIAEIAKNTYKLNAMVPIEEFNQFFGTCFEDEEVDTIGGIIMMQLGRLPKDLEVIVIANLSFKVMPFTGNRLEHLEVTQLHQSQ